MSKIIKCQCGKRLNIPDHLIGKSVKCPSCQNAVSCGEKDEPVLDARTRVGDNKRSPLAWAPFLALAAIVFFLGGFFLYKKNRLPSRWERENHVRMTELCVDMEKNAIIEEYDPIQSPRRMVSLREKYDALIALVGDRKIKDESRRKMIANAMDMHNRYNREMTQRRIAYEEELKRIMPTSDEYAQFQNDLTVILNETRLILLVTDLQSYMRVAGPAILFPNASDQAYLLKILGGMSALENELVMPLASARKFLEKANNAMATTNAESLVLESMRITAETWVDIHGAVRAMAEIHNRYNKHHNALMRSYEQNEASKLSEHDVPLMTLLNDIVEYGAAIRKKPWYTPKASPEIKRRLAERSKNLR